MVYVALRAGDVQEIHDEVVKQGLGYCYLQEKADAKAQKKAGEKAMKECHLRLCREDDVFNCIYL